MLDGRVLGRCFSAYASSARLFPQQRRFVVHFLNLTCVTMRPRCLSLSASGGRYSGRLLSPLHHTCMLNDRG